MSEDDFGKVLDAFDAEKSAGPSGRIGEIVVARVVSWDPENVYLDVGTKTEAVMPIADARDDEGRLACDVGDLISVRVVSVLPTAEYVVRRAHDVDIATRRMIEEARDTGGALEGVVTATTRGGIVVQVGSLRAFCPASHLEIHGGADPAFYVGQRLRFLILRISVGVDGDSELVLSRKALLVREADERSRRARSTLAVGAVVRGRVSSIKPYGAFVDLGGIDGFLPIDEISHAWVDHPRSQFSVGDELTMRIVGSDPSTKDGRLRLSIKATQPDPWVRDRTHLQPGRVFAGTIVSKIKSGFVVQILSGITGLLRSESVEDGADVTVGQVLKVTLLDVNADKRRLLLGLARGTPDASRGLATIGEVLRSKK